ncbi:lipopolysaccharide heptosyltransferase family protein [Vibrio sinensis]|uniref:Lipopolysaccharide heptosyltransferase family protein n=1 Tax=Vibrio sinensis TaxID=2302434 RepID=A0A3A6R5W6_9VIBR|nr:glycosyltransferase family 9 protein [Vibrio sinensis]RJX72392.1 lipopolysaccharide heptosyltransferase family protein [Vibrio sinensis]
MSHSYSFQKILVIATHCIGDSLLITTFTRSLREAYPNAQIDVLVNARGEMVFATNPDINNLVEISPRASFKDYFRILRARGRYDLVVNEMLNDRTAIYSFIFGKKRLGAVDDSLKGAWLKKRIFNWHIIEKHVFEHKMSRSARMLRLIGVDVVPRLISPEDALPDAIAHSLPEHYVVVHAPSSNEIKQWPVESWFEVVQGMLNMGYKVVLSGAAFERDETIVNEILARLPQHPNLYSVLGQLNLAQTSILLKNSMGFVGPDSGPGHMASGYPIPIISLISVAPASMWSPWPYLHKVNCEANLYKNGIAQQTIGNVTLLQSERRCVPCYKNKCAISDDFYSPCLQDIKPQSVIEAIKARIPIGDSYE